MVDDNRFKEIVITIIDSDGKEIDTERHQNESTHPQVFTRIEQEQIPGLFENYKLDVRRSSGFELAGFVAANNYCVFCPTNINNDKQMILFLPKVPTHEQCEKVKEILSKIEKVIRKIAHFSIYTFLGNLLMLLFSTYKIKNINRIYTSLVIGVVYAISDEEAKALLDDPEEMIKLLKKRRGI